MKPTPFRLLAASLALAMGLIVAADVPRLLKGSDGWLGASVEPCDSNGCHPYKALPTTCAAGDIYVVGHKHADHKDFSFYLCTATDNWEWQGDARRHAGIVPSDGSKLFPLSPPATAK
jgi:hypothetical protein